VTVSPPRHSDAGAVSVGISQLAIGSQDGSDSQHVSGSPHDDCAT